MVKNHRQNHLRPTEFSSCQKDDYEMDSISIDESKHETSSCKNSVGRRASLGDSFSIESDADDDARSLSSSNSDASNTIDEHPTIKAYELELRKAFAAVATVDQQRRTTGAKTLTKATIKDEEENTKIGGNISRRTSDDWDEMIQKKEEEKRRMRDATVVAQTAAAASSFAVVPTDDSTENDTTVLADVSDDNDVPENEKVQQREQTKRQKRRIMSLSILIILVLILILSLVIGLKGKVGGTSSQNLRGEHQVSTPTSKPSPTVVSSKQPTSSDESEVSTAATAEAAAVANATVAGATLDSSQTATNQSTKLNSTALVCDAVTSASDQCTSALQLLEKCTSSETASDGRYGTSIAINANGDDVLAVVGGHFGNHPALLSYDKSTRTWKHVSDLNSLDSNDERSSSSISYDRIGSAVAISSDWIAISNTFDTASVKLYEVSNAIQNGDNAIADLSIEQSDETPGSRFGSSLAIDEKVLVVGAVQDRGNAGSVYIYRDENGWNEVAKLQPEDVSTDVQGNFGHSVAISQGIVIVGAPNDTVNEKQRCGSVYIFQQVPGGFEFIQKLSPQGLLPGDQFGFAVTVDVAINPTTNLREDRIAIGTHMDDDKGTDSGSVYIYLRKDGERTFSPEQQLLPSDLSPKSAFGFSIGMRGHHLIVGSKGYGVASLFGYNGESWVEMGSTKDVDSGRALGDDFGSSVSIALWAESIDSDGGVVLVGAPLNDESGEDSGRIYSYAICSN